MLNKETPAGQGRSRSVLREIFRHQVFRHYRRNHYLTSSSQVVHESATQQGFAHLRQPTDRRNISASSHHTKHRSIFIMLQLQHTHAAATLALYSLLLQHHFILGSLSPTTSKGCYSSSNGLQFQGSDQYMTQGLCQDNCAAIGKPVMGLTGGSDCYCGDLLPPESAITSDSDCETVCNGFGQPCKYKVASTLVQSIFDDLTRVL